MASLKFKNPVLFEMGKKASAPKTPLDDDIESGMSSSRSSTPELKVSVKPVESKDLPLFVENTRFGLTGKGKRKTRKHKKGGKKTQKRRSRK